jgi:tripartite-type tricarboxylate transporter receptor subunit TctC
MLCRLLACAITVLVHLQPAFADAYPTKPIRFINPTAPGGTAEPIARVIAQKLSESLGQSVVVDSRGGAGGTVGTAMAANSPPDGYTILLGVVSPMAINVSLYGSKLPYDPLKDFAPVALLATNYLAVVANPDVPFKTAAEMIAWAKANPGKLTVATNGEGGFPHLAFEQLRLMAGFTFQHIPYKGATQIITDIMGGQVQLGIGAYTSMSPQVLSGRVRLIAVTNPTRVPNKPDLPIFAETVPGYESRGWFGYIAPAGTSRDIVLRLNDEINRAMKQPDVAEKLTAAGLIIVTEPPEFFGDIIKSEYAKYGKLIRDIGFEPQ